MFGFYILAKKVKKEKYSSSLKGRGRPANKMRTGKKLKLLN